jgi:hypothetical protein
MLTSAVDTIHRSMAMDRSVAITEREAYFEIIEARGFGSERPIGKRINLPQDVDSLLVNSTTTLTPILSELRDLLQLPYFVATRLESADTSGWLLTGRLQERRSYAPQIVEADLEALQSIAKLITTAL